MSVRRTAQKPAARKTTATKQHVVHEPLFEVILYNDDKNSMRHVVRSLVRVFGHSATLAAKIMVEAHTRGKAIAEVEAESEAILHRDQLQSLGLTVTIAKV